MKGTMIDKFALPPPGCRKQGRETETFAQAESIVADSLIIAELVVLASLLIWMLWFLLLALFLSCYFVLLLVSRF